MFSECHLAPWRQKIFPGSFHTTPLPHRKVQDQLKQAYEHFMHFQNLNIARLGGLIRETYIVN